MKHEAVHLRLSGVSADWLRRRFVTLPSGPDINEDGAAEGDARRTPAAVLIPVVEHGDALSILLTRRTEHLSDHPGQIAFPGGRAEEHDDSPVTTALRETEEEIGLARHHIEVLGTLPRYLTGTGFSITPVVGLVRPPFELALDAFEVAEAFEVPLDFLLDSANHKQHSMEYRGRRRNYWAMAYGEYFIWGATAGILRSLQRMLAVD